MNPLRCDEVKNSLIDYLEFELPLARREHLYEHLAHCSSCQATHDEMQQVLGGAKNIEIVDPPQSYWDELPEKVLKEVKSLRSVESITPVMEEDEVGGVSDKDSQAFSNDGKVVAFTRINKRMSGAKEVKNISFREDNIRPAASTTQVKSTKKPIVVSWPKLAFPIAAALLIGIAATFTFLEKESVIVQDHIGFQAQIQSDQSLAQLAQKLAPHSQSGNQLGFSSQQVLFNEFSIGSLFSEAKAYATSEQLAALKTHLALLKTALINEVNPQHGIIRSVSQLQQQLIAQNNINEVSQTLARLLNEYASSVRGQDGQRYELVKAGAWLFDYALAALAKDDASIRQVSQLSSLARALQESKAPPGVVNSLNRIQGIAQQPTISNREYQQILKEVENIRSLLG